MIETERLTLSALTEAERAPFTAMTADPEVMHDYPAPFAAVEASERFDRYLERQARDGFGRWAVRRKHDGAFLGLCGVGPIWPALPPAPGLEIGWRLLRAAWGFGYATEAARASLADIFARIDAEEVISFTNDFNNRSLAVMARLGLTRDPSRDFLFETGLAAVVFTAPRSRYAVAAGREDGP